MTYLKWFAILALTIESSAAYGQWVEGSYIIESRPLVSIPTRQVVQYAPVASQPTVVAAPIITPAPVVMSTPMVTTARVVIPERIVTMSPVNQTVWYSAPVAPNSAPIVTPAPPPQTVYFAPPSQTVWYSAPSASVAPSLVTAAQPVIAQPVITQSPVIYPSPNYVVYSNPLPMTMYRPVVAPIQPTYVVGRGVVGQTTIYVPGQPIRNVVRFVSP